MGEKLQDACRFSQIRARFLRQTQSLCSAARSRCINCSAADSMLLIQRIHLNRSSRIFNLPVTSKVSILHCALTTQCLLLWLDETKLRSIQAIHICFYGADVWPDSGLLKLAETIEYANIVHCARKNNNGFGRHRLMVRGKTLCPFDPK